MLNDWAKMNRMVRITHEPTSVTAVASGAADLPEALRLADIADDESWAFVIGVRKDIAVELRRLHALAAVVPANMQVTEKMRAAGDCARVTADRVDSVRVFRAMLAAAPAQPAAQQGMAYAALPEYGINTASHAHFRVLGFTADQMRAFADATHTLRASHGQAPANPDPAYSAACHLATALFKKHFAHLPDFASGQAVWSLCGSTAGVISQIDNMVAGLVRPPTTSSQADNKKKDPL